MARQLYPFTSFLFRLETMYSEAKLFMKCPTKDTRGTPSTILRINEKWACVTSIKDPHYFPLGDQGQHPKVSPLHAARYLVFNISL